MKAIPMNRREDDFGYLLPLEYGENVIVLVADDGAGNLSSKLLRVERSDRFTARIDSPAFGKFANGETQTVAGAVSRELRVDEADGGASQLTLASLTVAGVPVTLTGGGGSQSYSVAMAPPGCTNSIMPIIISACWTGSTFSASYTNICAEVPLGLLEGYEIVEKKSQGYTAYGTWLFRHNPELCSVTWFYGIRWEIEEGFALGCVTEGGPRAWRVDEYRFESPTPLCLEGPALELVTWGTAGEWWPSTTNQWSMMQPSRGLVMGQRYWRQEWQEAGQPVPEADYVPRVVTAARLRFRAPFYYPAGTVVLLTLEGVRYTVPSPTEAGTNVVMDLTAVKLKWGGEVREPVSTNENQCTYLVTVNGGQEYELDETSFEWPQHEGSNESSPGVTHNWRYHTLTFTGFHNGEIVGPECILNPRWHHLLPQDGEAGELKRFFESIFDTERGGFVNIDDAKWGLVLDMDEHIFLHNIKSASGNKTWLDEWRAWRFLMIQQGHNPPTYAQLQEQLTKMKNDKAFAKYIAKGKQARHSYLVWRAHGDDVQLFIREWAQEKHAAILTKVPRKSKLVGKLLKAGGKVVGVVFLVMDVSAAETSDQVFQALWRNDPIIGSWWEFGEEIGNAVGMQDIWYALISIWNALQLNPELQWYRKQMRENYLELFGDEGDLTPGTGIIPPW